MLHQHPQIMGKGDSPKQLITIPVEQPYKDPPIDKLAPRVECNADDTTREIVNEQQKQQVDVHVPIAPNVEHDAPKNIVKTE